MPKNKETLINFSDSIFVAGAKGMVGSSITRLLLKKGYGDKSKGGDLLTPSRKELNLCDYSDVKIWFKKNKPSVVIIAAAKVGGIMANSNSPTEFLIENLKIQNNIIESSLENNVKRLLFLGSSCIYPRDANQPIKEQYLLSNILEETNESYAIAKIAGIKLCDAMRRQYKFDAFSLMPSNLYGPGDNYNLTNSHVLPALIFKFHDAVKKNKKEVICWGTGKPLREFLFVDDLADACIFALENWDLNKINFSKNIKESIPSWINIGNNEEFSIKELAEKIASISGFEGKIKWDIDKPDGTYRKKLDTSLAEALGWRAKTNINIGLKKTLKNFLKNYNVNNLRS